MGAAALPLIEVGIAAGPVGWAILAVVAVGLLAYAVYEASDSADSTFDPAPLSDTQPCPGTPPTTATDDPPIPKDKPVPWVPWIPTDGESHPHHDDVDIARDIAKSGTGDCDKIAWAIDTLTRDLKFRRWDYQRSGGDPGHAKAYKLRQEDLQRLIKLAKAFGCKYNPEADSESTKGLGSPTPSY